MKRQNQRMKMGNGEKSMIFTLGYKIEAAIYMPISIASKRDNSQKDKQVILSTKAIEFMSHSLINLTSGDRIAGESRQYAQIVTPVKVELLLECTSVKLSQIVGRLKCRTASAHLWDREKEKHTWSKGFWYAQLLDTISQQIVLNYFKKHNTTKTV